MAETENKTETKPPVKPEAAKPTNCAKCNKQFKNKLWYYKNGKYYCTKACWRASLKAQKPAAAA
ncbi:MAG: hypothetical protein NTV07_03215 [Candidatus Omnitrophica bacterium]|nr:hypothetical protein [Candidatus Omnitrophota bacterium]